MAIVAPLQGHFDGGELSPRLYGRVDADRYKGALALCKNWIATLQGDLPRRPGTYYLGQTKTAAQARLVPFQFSITQAYMLEFGDFYIRFWANRGQVLSGGVPYEVSTPYPFNVVNELKFTQSADVLYITHPNYRPRKLERFDVTNWQLVPLYFIDGPYLPINTSQVTATPSAVSGSAVTVTFGPSQTITNCVAGTGGAIRVTVASHGWITGQPIYIGSVVGTTEANGDWRINVLDQDTFELQGSTFTHAYVSGGTLVPTGSVSPKCAVDNYLSGDNALDNRSGSVIRLEHSSTWGWGYVTGNPAPGVLTVNVQSNFGATTASKSWRLGMWKYAAGGENCPGATSFHEDRLCFSGTPSNPQRIDMSNVSDYENFAPSAADGTVTPSNACNFSLNSNDVNAIEWLSSDEKGLLVGGLSAEWLMRPSINSDAITPTNVNAKKSSKWGSTDSQAISVGNGTLHIQRGGRKLRELAYTFYLDKYQSTNLSELAEHITKTGVSQLAYTAIPYPIVWMIRNDGALIGATYDRDQQQLRMGWHWHVLGGQSDSAGTPPVVKSIAVIPSPDGSTDDLWMLVLRWINGAFVQTVEYLTKIFEDIDLPQNAFFLDCGLTLDSPIDVTGITKASPAVVTAPAHGLSTGNSVRFDSIVGMTQLNGNAYTITVINANSFSLDGVDSTFFNTYVTGGQVRKRVTTLSGLSVFNGETFAVWADGKAQASKTVSGGAITLDSPAAVISVGYAYNSDGQQLRLEAGSRNGTSIGKTRRTHRVASMVHRSQGLMMGPSFDQMDSIQLNANGDADTLFSGIESHTFGSDYDFDNPVCFRVSTPHPCTMLAIMPMMETQDRA